MDNVSAVILAGGEGKRMKSDKPKALSLVCCKPMLHWILKALKESTVDRICIVTGYKKEFIEKYIHTLSYDISTAFQSERLGTGHAVMMASDFLKAQNDGDVIILNGDAPFMDSKTVSESYKAHKENMAAATVISAKVDNPYGYGRIVRNSDGSLSAITEQKDASDEIRKINEVNSGAYWFNTRCLLDVLFEIKSDNAAEEYYLTDAIKLLSDKGKRVEVFTADSSDTVLGANDEEQLLRLNEIAKKRFLNK